MPHTYRSEEFEKGTVVMVQAPVVQSTDAIRWQRALSRAIDHALDVLIEPISGEAY